jgi:hypothetical protein
MDHRAVKAANARPVLDPAERALRMLMAKYLQQRGSLNLVSERLPLANERRVFPGVVVLIASSDNSRLREQGHLVPE